MNLCPEALRENFKRLRGRVAAGQAGRRKLPLGEGSPWVRVRVGQRRARSHRTSSSVLSKSGGVGRA